jgi:biofilm PGA synthesis N-glycosyltransferase PgaC
MGCVILLSLAGIAVRLPPQWQTSIIPGWHGLVLGLTCLLQFTISMLLDCRYDRKLFQQFSWMIWYPLVYWTISMFTTIYAVPKVLLRRRGLRAVWVSPDRGLQSLAKKNQGPSRHRDSPH